MNPIAYLLAIASAFCNAVFFAPNRLESVQKADLHPIIYNWYTTIGVFIFSWFVALFNPLVGMPIFALTPVGFLAGGLFTLALCFSCLALPLIGLTVGLGTWASVAILVSFSWGTIGPEQIRHSLVSWPISLIAIFMVTAGCVGIVNVDALGDFLFCKTTLYKQMDEELSEFEKEELKKKQEEEEGGAKKKALGVFYAVCVGCFGGSMLAPLAFTPPEYAGIHGLAFIPSFGTGSLITGTAIMLGMWAYTGEMPRWEVKRTLWAGLVSGTIWQIGNVCQVVAQSFYLLPYAIAYPIFQASLVIAGMLGITVFNEIVGFNSISAYFVAAVVVVTGSVLLAIYGPV